MLLPEASDVAAVETINAALSGTNRSCHRQILLNRGLEYEPDLVILHFVLNNVEQNLGRRGPNVEFFTEYTATYKRADNLSNWSYLWGWARNRYLRRVRGARYIRDCLKRFQTDSAGWLETREALSDINRICYERSIPLLVVIFPFFYDLDGDYPFQPIHNVVREYCIAQGIAVLDLRQAYRGHDGPDLWVHPTNQHPNEVAHKIAAREIAANLRGHADAFGLI